MGDRSVLAAMASLFPTVLNIVLTITEPFERETTSIRVGSVFSSRES